MPSKSPAQHNLMEAVDHNAAFARRVGIPQSVGAEFVAADKARGGLLSHASKAKRAKGAKRKKRL